MNNTSIALNSLAKIGYDETGLADILGWYRWSGETFADFRVALKDLAHELEAGNYGSDTKPVLDEWEEAEIWRLAKARALAEERAEQARRKAGTVHLADVFKAARAA